MDKVFITKAKVSALMELLDFNKIYNYEDLIYSDRLCKILSTGERNYLLNYKSILENIGDIPIYDKNNRNKFTNNRKRMVFEGGPPSFHLYLDCSFLTSNYENYEIPIEIEDSNIDEYRRFFIKEIELFKEKPDVFYAKVGTKFAVHIKNVKSYNAENSGVKQIDNVELTDPEEIIIKIKDHLFKMEQYRHSSPEYEKIITNNGFATHKTKDKSPILKKWHNYKNKLKSLIKSYFISKLNPEFEFKKSVLEQCGYKLCKTCSLRANPPVF